MLDYGRILDDLVSISAALWIGFLRSTAYAARNDGKTASGSWIDAAIYACKYHSYFQCLQKTSFFLVRASQHPFHRQPHRIPCRRRRLSYWRRHLHHRRFLNHHPSANRWKKARLARAKVKSKMKTMNDGRRASRRRKRIRKPIKEAHVHRGVDGTAPSRWTRRTRGDNRRRLTRRLRRPKRRTMVAPLACTLS